jgi:hypothetical protein
MHLIARAAFVGLLFLCATAQAQVQEEIRRCASIAADAERLACYDRLFRDSRAAASAPAAAAGTAAGAAAPSGAAPAGAGAAPAGAGAAPAGGAASGAPAGGASAPAAGAAAGAAAAGSSSAAAGADFGTNPRLQEEQRRKERASEGAQDMQELHERIKKIDPHPYGLHVLTLENGQVWQQKEKVWELELKPGDPVVIRRGMLGSYRVQPEGQTVSASVVRVK